LPPYYMRSKPKM